MRVNFLFFPHTQCIKNEKFPTTQFFREINSEFSKPVTFTEFLRKDVKIKIRIFHSVVERVIFHMLDICVAYPKKLRNFTLTLFWQFHEIFVGKVRD